MLLKIGELAKRAGLSVRTLHHYDAIGLLSPSVRTDSGLRHYGQSDVVRLHRIQALKQLGYSLSEIRKNLDDPGIEPLQIIERQIRAFEEQARQARELSEQLRDMAARLSGGGRAKADDWLNLLEMMTLYGKHLTEQEVRTLRNPGGAVASDIAAQWTRLVSAVEQAMRDRVPHDSPDAHALAWRWMRLVIAMTGNDAVLANKLKAMHEQEARAQEIMGIGPDQFKWIGQVFAHARAALFARHLSPADTAEIRRRHLATMPHMNDWPQLVAKVREQMEAGVPAETEPVQALARRWQQLFRDSYCGDDPALEARVRAVFAREPDLMLGVGVDAALLAYVQKAMAQLGRSQGG